MQIDYTVQKTMNNPSYRKGEIVENEQRGTQYYRLKVSLSQPIGPIMPGQFAMLSIEGTKDILLPRPFSIHNFDDGENASQLDFLIKVVGKGSTLLAQLLVGSPIRVLAPLGKGFPAPPLGYKIIAVAGGIGIAPLFPLIVRLKTSNIALHLFYGAKSREDLICLHELLKLEEIAISISTEDGTSGEHGIVTKLLKHKIPQDGEDMVMYACGPEPMLKAVAEFAEDREMPCWISLERRMACGVGACLGCVVNTKKGYTCSCLNGPVFESKEIMWQDDAES
jgi:dihydroorotate dehydrogenase electron transfer subunit